MSTSERNSVHDSEAPAGLLRRAFAQALDLGLAAAVMLGVLALSERFADAPLGSWLGPRGGLRWSASLALPAWLVLTLLEWLPGNASPGKRILGMRLIGSRRLPRISFARIALRTLIKLLPWHIGAIALSLPQPWDPREPLELSRLLWLLGSNLWLGLYLACAAMTRRRQSLHDLLVGTLVLRTGETLPSAAGPR